LALARSGQADLSLREAHGVLRGAGLTRAIPHAFLMGALAKAATADPRFHWSGDRFSAADPRRLRWDVERLASAVCHEARQRGVLRTPATPLTREPPRGRVVLVPLDAAPRRASSQKPTPGAPGRARSAAPASVPSPAAAAALPPPQPAGEPKLDWTDVDLAAVDRLLRGPRVEPARIAHHLDALALASADRFEELLAFGTLRGVEPHAYQQETVRRVLRQHRGRALLADEVGLGKTVEAIIALAEYRMRGMVRRALVLVPPALASQWAGELREKAGIEAIVATAEHGWDQDGVVVASLALARTTRAAPRVAARPWDLVIVDEAHRLKNRSTLAWKLVDALHTRFLLLLTATPVETGIEEIHNLVTLLRPGQLSTPAEFRREYVDKKDPTSPRNRERLRGLLGDVMVRNTRAGCGLRLSVES
jgi:hypothetical protein